MEEHLKQVYQKVASYCAYQERTHEEVREKLEKLYVLPDDIDIILARLITDNYLNEQRFATSFAGGKFRIKKWGRKRIQLELKRKNVSEYNIRSALKEITDTDYKATLAKLAIKKLEALAKKENNKLIQKKKLVNFLVQKGYEPELVWQVANDLVKD